ECPNGRPRRVMLWKPQRVGPEATPAFRRVRSLGCVSSTARGGAGTCFAVCQATFDMIGIRNSEFIPGRPIDPTYSSIVGFNRHWGASFVGPILLLAIGLLSSCARDGVAPSGTATATATATVEVTGLVSATPPASATASATPLASATASAVEPY